MIKLLKTLAINIAVSINVLIIVLMLLVGFSDRIDPEAHPMLACAGMIFPVFPLANALMLCFWVVFSWRRLWIPVVGFVLAYVPINIYVPMRAMHDPPPGTLKVLSYNVSGYGGTPDSIADHFGAIFDYICQQQPDIVCIQEENDTWRNVEKRYAEKFKYNMRVNLGRDSSKWHNHIGMHTRFPIIHSEVIDAPSVTTVNGAVAFYLDAGTDTIMVVGCHLENIHLNRKDRKQYKEILKGDMERDTVRAEGMQLLYKFSGAIKARAAQVKAIRRYINQHRGTKPLIVCGDFNDTPISFTRHTLADGFTDCYAASGCGLGLSYNQKGFNFRIDHFICSSDMQPVRCVVDSKLSESDHFPLLCWLKMGHNP